jgi:RHS repeat-associated protein
LGREALTPDGFDRLSTTTYPNSSTQVLAYDADSNVRSRRTRAGATISFTYDTLNRLSTKAAPSGPSVTYSYDLANHPLGFVDNSSSMVVPSTVGTIATLTSTYDSLNNLTGSVWGPAVVQTAPSTSSVAFTHVYDATNRRVSQTATDNSYWSYPTATASTVSYTANNLDQYSAIGSVTPTYDGNGNLTFDGVFTYGYDAENRLISASGAGNTASYAYDAQGRRKSKTVNGTTTIFVQDPQGRALLDYDGTSGTIQNWYAFGSGPNDVLNQINVAGSTRATYVPDIQGSIVASLDASSGALTKAGYQTYGESSVTSGTFRYTGARIDAETNGLYDFRARMYSPVLGRFMQADPIGAAGGINLYAYTDNDPLNQTDTSGNCPACAGAIVGGIGGLLFQAGSDLFHGSLSPASSYAGAIVGGAAGGAAATVCGPTCAGAVAGAASNFVTNGLNGTLSVGSLAAGTAVGAIGGAVAGQLVPAAFLSLSPGFNSLKGDIGEGLTALGLISSGQSFETQVSNGVGKSTFDFLLENGSFVESKFGTASLSSPKGRPLRTALMLRFNSGAIRRSRVWGQQVFRPQAALAPRNSMRKVEILAR